MKPRRLLVTPQAKQDFEAIIAWYRNELGTAAAAKAARTIQAGLRACARVSLAHATRPDLPDGYYRVVAKSHVIVFQAGQDIARIIRILHGARDIAALLEHDGD